MIHDTYSARTEWLRLITSGMFLFKGNSKGIKSAYENVHLTCTWNLKVLPFCPKLINVHGHRWGKSLGLDSGFAPKAISVFIWCLVPKFVPHSSGAVTLTALRDNWPASCLYLIWSYLCCIYCCQGVLLGQDRWTDIPLALCFIQLRQSPACGSTWRRPGEYAKSAL